jgi:hypothetical protein
MNDLDKLNFKMYCFSNKILCATIYFNTYQRNKDLISPNQISLTQQVIIWNSLLHFAILHFAFMQNVTNGAYYILRRYYILRWRQRKM